MLKLRWKINELISNITFIYWYKLEMNSDYELLIRWKNKRLYLIYSFNDGNFKSIKVNSNTVGKHTSKEVLILYTNNLSKAIHKILLNDYWYTVYIKMLDWIYINSQL